ncbi:hypothetical protein BGX33_010798 [Mortierella sp. NVP41]|nr:hypothetical protein BGX33_010798 [Mortierella sp. NVP41]
MSGPSRPSSASRHRETSDSPSFGLPDEGYYEQRAEIPKWALRLSEEQRAVHLLSYLDEKSLMNVSLVCKAWNRFASDNAVWKGIYLRHGWSVNQDMIDWYLRTSELEMASIAQEQEQEQELERELKSHFSTRSEVSNGKRRKVIDVDSKDDGAERSGDDYDMLQDVTGPYDRYPEEHGDRKMQRLSSIHLDPQHQPDMDTLAEAPSGSCDVPTALSPDIYDEASTIEHLIPNINTLTAVKALWTSEV